MAAAGTITPTSACQIYAPYSPVSFFFYSDGSYYYQNTDGSKYYNSGSGYAQYTSPSGQTSKK